ncbi:hypothetical protein HYV31_01845 [candidate division WWE3 bacterium]|nr:hypothetical protein [candidate division WWE3 bacterium]
MNPLIRRARILLALVFIAKFCTLIGKLHDGYDPAIVITKAFTTAVITFALLFLLLILENGNNTNHNLQ